eukprot:91685_1
MLFRQNKTNTHDDFVSVHSLWICRSTKIIAESQLGSVHQNDKQRKFVSSFIVQIIEPSKTSKSNKGEPLDSAFTIYIKKRQYLFHVLYDGELTFLSLTCNTLRQEPVQRIFDLLYTMQSSLIFEGDFSFTDTLADVHESYQCKSQGNSKVSLQLSHSSRTKTRKNTFSPTYSRDIYDNDLNFDFSDGYANHEPFYSLTNTLQTTVHLGSPSMSNPIYLHSPTASTTHSHSRSSLKNYLTQMEDEKTRDEMQYLILKRGWMTKMGDTFKTWKWRYFELWSNGLLNYFENELKLKKKGSLNIPDEVISAQLYVNQQSEYGFMLVTENRTWCFAVNKERLRDDWFLLIQLIAFSKMDVNAKLRALKIRLEKLDFLWQSEFKEIECELLHGNDDCCNIYQLQYDLKTANDICNQCKKEISFFCGSDVFSVYSPKVEDISENMERVSTLLDGIIHARNETPFKHRKRHKSYLSRKREKLYKKQKKKRMKQKDGVLLKGKILTRLPSKKLISAKNALSKKIRVLEVEVREGFFEVNIERANTAPLLWKFDEIDKISEIQGVYFGKRKTGSIRLNDIHQFQITISHLSNRRLQFVFENEKEAYLWFKTLSTLFDKCNQTYLPKRMQYKPNTVAHNTQIGL